MVERTCRLLSQRRLVKGRKRDLQNIFMENTSHLLSLTICLSRGSPLHSSPAPFPIPPLRFDLTTPILPSVSLNLPTHLGLHHHAESSYTLDEFILLTRSSISAQRSTILEVLGKEKLKYLLLRYATYWRRRTGVTT